MNGEGDLRHLSGRESRTTVTNRGDEREWRMNVARGCESRLGTAPLPECRVEVRVGVLRRRQLPGWWVVDPTAGLDLAKYPNGGSNRAVVTVIPSK
jgi:hypothetical protein